MQATRLYAVFLCFALSASACGGPGSETEKTASSTGALVDFGVAVTPFGGPNASETATLVNESGQLVVAFNFDDPAHVSYPFPPFGANTRLVCPGAAGEAVAISSNAATGGQTTFPNAPLRLVPPPGIAGLWGDPNIGQIPGTGYVFATTLALPQSKFPTTCDFAPGACGPGVGCITGEMGGTTLGGACVARSLDGGQSFSVAAGDCFGSTTNGVLDFYDGSAIVGMTNPFGSQGSQAVFAAFNNLTQNKNTIDVWMAPTPTAAFSQLDNPFPGITFQSHARLVSMPETNPAGMGIAAADTSGTLWFNEYFLGIGWGSAPNWPRVIASDYNRSDITLQNGVSMRRGAQFEMADMINWDAPTNAVFVLYGSSANGHATLKSAVCYPMLSESICHPLMTIDPGVNVFNPGVGSAIVFNSLPPPNAPFGWDMRFSWEQEVGGGSIEVFSGNVVTNPNQFQSRVETGSEVPCPDDRPTGGGYWGDYDSQMGVYQPSNQQTPLFWRSFSDSTGGNCNRETFNSTPVNVSSTWISP